MQSKKCTSKYLFFYIYRKFNNVINFRKSKFIYFIYYLGENIKIGFFTKCLQFFEGCRLSFRLTFKQRHNKYNKTCSLRPGWTIDRWGLFPDFPRFWNNYHTSLL